MMTDHQRKQIEIVNQLEEQVRSHTLNSSTISPVDDFENDSRICLTSVHFPHENLISRVRQTLIEPLRKLEPDFYYYPPDSLHMTIKNVRVIHDPPNFSGKDIEAVKHAFSRVIPTHHPCTVYFYRLLLFPNNLALIGTTDSGFDRLILALGESLTSVRLSDDKIYLNPKYFFCNMTLTRFSTPPSQAFKQKVKELSETLSFDPYTIDSVALISANAVMKKRTVYETWTLER